MLNRSTFQYDPELLLHAVEDMYLGGTLNSKTTQFGFVYPQADDENNSELAIGSLKNSTLTELDFNHFHSHFVGSVFHDFYNQLQEYSPFILGRMRLMVMKPKTCLSLHEDRDIRYHFALKTDERCLIMGNSITGWRVRHIPKDGFVYQFNARNKHTAINGTEDIDRIHIVVCTTGVMKDYV